MKLTEMKVSIANLFGGYVDNDDEGAYCFSKLLCIRPMYQRNFVYSLAKEIEVIKTIVEGCPINYMYWAKVGDKYELMDGQQRTLSICHYIHGDYSVDFDGNAKFWINLTKEQKLQILNYEVVVQVFEGTEEEKMKLFKRINVDGMKMTPQEMLNSVYCGEWLTDAKKYFSKRNCVAKQMADGYLKGDPNRQEILEKVLKWVADRDGLKDGQEYMAIHQHDKDANDLWIYYQSVINWAKMIFARVRKALTDCQDWGILYNKYHNNIYNSNDIEKEIERLILDYDVTNKKGIITYVLDNTQERALSIRAFAEAQKRTAYELQRGICPICGMNFDYEDMQGDHITPWSKGGHTTQENCQMLCCKCNRTKSNK